MQEEKTESIDLREGKVRSILARWVPPLLVLLIAALLLVKLNDVDKVELTNQSGRTFEKGVVTRILRDNRQEDGTRVGEQAVVVRMTSGKKAGDEVTATSSAGFLFGAPCTVGLKVVVVQSVAGDTVVTSVYSRDRGNVLIGYALLYLITLAVIGGRQGLRGALGLVFTVGSIVYVYLPLVYRGFSPFWSAVLVCAVAATVTLYLVSGPNLKTLVAIMGTLAGVIIAGLAAALFSAASSVTGWNVSNIETLLTLWNTRGIQVEGLLFSGLLIAALGAVMDVAMSVSSAMNELCVQDPAIPRRELFSAGMRIGRDIMGTDSNTLILAFAGTSISMLVLNYAYDLPWLQVINSNNIGVAVMEGLSGSFGVILSIPATVAFAAWLFPMEGGTKPRGGRAPAQKVNARKDATGSIKRWSAATWAWGLGMIGPPRQRIAAGLAKARRHQAPPRSQFKAAIRGSAAKA